MREVEPHWGDLPGQPPVPRRPVYLGDDHYRMAESVRLALLLALAGFIVAGAIVAAAAQERLLDVPPACSNLARRAGLPQRVTRDEADRALRQLASMAETGEVARCRDAIQAALRRR